MSARNFRPSREGAQERLPHEGIGRGFDVLADKPMAINPAQFKQLRKAFAEAAKKKLILYDIMTERYEITAILQRELQSVLEVGKESGKTRAASADLRSMVEDALRRVQILVGRHATHRLA